MRILFVCHRVPFPPKRGGKIRPFNIISHLTKQGHAVTVASIARSNDELKEAEGLREHCQELLVDTVGGITPWWKMLIRGPSLTPSSMGYFFSRRLQKQVDACIERTNFDLVMVHCSSVAQYVAHVPGIPKILDFGDMDSQKWKIYGRVRPFPLSLIYRWEGLKLERVERLLANAFDYCTATTRAELETLNGLAPNCDTGWFPNGVDTNYFSPSEVSWDSKLVGFVGRMDYFPNQQAVIEFSEHLFPQLRKEIPDLKFRVVGANPSSRIRNLSRQPGIEVTGSVPDVRPHVRQFAVSIAPLRIARGTQNKILESMAMGVPVVCSPEAAKGVDAVPGEHLLQCHSAAEYQQSIAEIIEKTDIRQRLATAGRERVLSHHSWERSMQQLDAHIARCMAATQTGAVG